jgi:AraC family transcriptional regulator
LFVPKDEIHGCFLIRKEIIMEPVIITKPTFSVVGMQYIGKNQNQEIAQMWGEFNPRMKEIEGFVEGNAYGVCSMVPGAPDSIDYVAGFEVSGNETLPEGMVSVKVPEQRYAVFEHRGSLEKLPETFHIIHEVWLPKSGYRHANGPELEVYDERFTNFSPDSVLYIYIPVE